MSCKASLSTRAGSHSYLILEAHAGVLSTFCHFNFNLSLPAEGFIDSYELSSHAYTFSAPERLLQRLEEPTIADRQTQVIIIEGRNMGASLGVQIPFHMRYPIPQDSELSQDPTAHAQHVRFEWPTVSWTCINSTSYHYRNGEGQQSSTNSIACTGAGPLRISLPSPTIRASSFVEAVTACTGFSTLLVTIYCIWTVYPFRLAAK